MFVSFLLPSVFEGIEARHLLVFYKQLADFGKDQIAFVGESAYFRPPRELEADGRPEWQGSWREAYDYEPPASLEDVDYQALPHDLLVPRLSRLQSSWKLYGQMVTRRLPELEAAFGLALDHLSARHTLEAAVTFANLPSLSHVARRRGLPVIHTEFGPLRKPAYAMTGYWDLSGVSRKTDAGRRYRQFRREVARSPLPDMSQDELLQALRLTEMPQVVEAADAPFRVGLALQGEENAHVHGVSALDCLSLARQHFHQRDILVRYHPGGLARYAESLGVTDTSSDATDFILKCERIVTVNSGAALEALLLGRRCVVLGDSPFSIAAERSFETVTRRDAAEQRRALNFLVFGYLVPCALMFDADYTRWRLSGPSETDIFRYHQGWYRSHAAATSKAPKGLESGASEAPVVIRPVESPVPPTEANVEEPATCSAIETPTILMVYPYCLDQVGHGNIQRVLSMARYLAGNGFAVDLVYQGNPRVAQVAGQYAAFRRVYRVEGGALSSDDNACARRLAAFYSAHEPPAAHLRPSAPLTTLARALIDAEPYQAVVATYAWTAPIFAGLARRVPLVCDVQDILHEHADACRRTTGHSSSFSLPAATEAFLWRQWDLLVAITPEDAVRIRRDLLPHQRVLSVRHAAPEIVPAALPGEDDVVLYAASDNMSNVQALQWLLDRVWPRVIERRPQARLQIAGLICRALPESAHRLRGVEVLGFRPDLSTDTAKAGVVVAPYLYGSGLKIKVVEAACGGKAIVTTRAGVAGTGLQCREAVAVEDEPAAFANGLVRLLGDSDRRFAVAAATLEQARDLFSAEACYGPVVVALRGFATALVPRSEGPGFSPAALRRIATVVEGVRPTRVVLWGNGAHTRSLIVALGTVDVAVALIVDGRATTTSSSPEGIAVAPGHGFGVTPGDLVILSSETFENDMWHALSAYRAGGGWVLGLWDERRISRALLDRLSPGARTELGVPRLQVREADAPPALFLWDSYATSSRWWRVQMLQELATAAHERGIAAIAITSSTTGTTASDDAGWQATTVVPALELDGRSLEDRDSDISEAPDQLARLATLMARATTTAVNSLTLGPEDLVLLMSPSLSECFAVARTVGASQGPAPSIVIHGLAPSIDGPHWPHLSESDRRAYWRLAVGALADAAAGRLTLVVPDSRSAMALEEFLERPVRVIGFPLQSRSAMDRASQPSAGLRVVCFGHVCANVRPLLEAIIKGVTPESLPGPVSVSWRSKGHGTGPSASDRWAAGLATMLGVELLDDHTPAEVLGAIAGADVIVVADGPRDQWAESVCAHAAAAGVPVIAPANGLAALAIAEGTVRGRTFTPGDTEDLLAQLGQVIHAGPSRSTRDRNDSSDAELLTPTVPAMLDRLLVAAGYGQTLPGDHSRPVQTSHDSLITEIAHAAAY